MTRVVYHPVIGRTLSLARWIWPPIAHLWYREIPESAVSDGPENLAVCLAKP